ncbi:IclR family transcriptional regulator [Burkholderia oklahomensis]|uniref:IclR family transcriptional regulator n=1 Tax=Burkholderia oklahomensis TaxID=342113 RepID=UPI00016A750A|nr:IclR family transcriptional regulator [Burkholderia oklahomensis]AJX36160.1 iclR helix-turn-helix domain protein [Burkholderia oklahomensis C6786]AOI49783.1 IclR family transcriptional regulator [Burkholderia oklahomensis C6786]KUY52829.1 IclR family transcriptional regulator [Burkholderia oklahomensis C6786]MBI0361914.1 IclR family transcriptional regulator [Burkholderia oklahomensis]SUY28863.1 Transcriptional regulator kdgR [Burkholderia oklahomensis]
MNYIVDAVDSALKLLSYVAEHPHLGVTELASKLGINKSRTYRMLCTLELHRFVVQDERTSTYALGPQAFVIGVAASQQNALVRAAQRHMLALSQAINETVVLRVREGLETVCVARCETTHEIRTIGSVGNRRPISLGASGKVLLAFAPDAVRDEFFIRVRKTAQGDPLRLVEELDAIARKGYAVSVGEVTAGAVAIAVPVRDLTGAAVASVSVTGPEMRVSRAEIPDYLERLQACSHAISAELGYVPARAALQPA